MQQLIYIISASIVSLVFPTPSFLISYVFCLYNLKKKKKKKLYYGLILIHNGKFGQEHINHNYGISHYVEMNSSLLKLVSFFTRIFPPNVYTLFLLIYSMCLPSLFSFFSFICAISVFIVFRPCPIGWLLVLSNSSFLVFHH